ncbi:MAG: transcription termination factor Rho [bacterium]
MNERRRPPRRGRGTRPSSRPTAEIGGEDNPYRESPVESLDAPDDRSPEPDAPTDRAPRVSEAPAPSSGERPPAAGADGPPSETNGASAPATPGDRTRPEGTGAPQGHPRDQNQNSRRGRRNRGRGRRDSDKGPAERQPGSGGAPPGPAVLVPTGETKGWFDPARDGGFIRRAQYSYLADAADAYVPPHIARQYSLRKSDEVTGTTGRDPRGRIALIEVTSVNGVDPATAARRPDFNTLIATYPERKLFLETGRPAKAGNNELTRRAIDLIAPIGYGQRALIVAPARAGKTTLLHAITEGIVANHPTATLLILLVDERPEEVSEAISWEVGEVIASSFDQPAARHVEVTEMVLERSRRLVEMGKDVIIVLDSLTRMARAHNTAERGTGRTMSGGLDAQAMAKPKAFFGSARSVAANSGGGSLTIIATALVETGSRMDDIIFEEFKGTGNCEIKLDRSLAEKRIYPAIDIATSATRREEKLFRPDQLEHVYTLRRGLGQMPPQSGMEWLIKRIANTPNNDALLEGL